MKTRVEIEFDLPDEEWDFQVLSNRYKIYNAVSEVQGKIRERWKYAEGVTEDEHRFLEELREILFQVEIEES